MDLKGIEVTVIKCLSDDSFLDKMVTRLTARVRDAVVDALSASLREARSRIEQLDGEVGKLRTELQRVELQAQDKQDELEQYQRRNSLRFFGVPETTGEVAEEVILQLISEKIGVSLPANSLERTHRVGKPRQPDADGSPRPRPIVAKFLNYRDRRVVFSKKKGLKGTGVVLREDLTPRRAAVLRRAIDIHGSGKVWTADGRIIWEAGGGNRRSATSLKDLAQ